MSFELEKLLKLTEELPSYREMLSRLKDSKTLEIDVLALDSARPFLIAALYEQLNLPVILITAQPESAKRMIEQISMWCSNNSSSIFPEPDTLPYQRTIADFSIEQDRLEVLFTLAGPNQGKNRTITITSALSLIQKTTPVKDFSSSCRILKTGMEIDPVELIRDWEAIGYRFETMVEVPGTISRRGGIVDIFPPSSELPVRLEFFGNTVESIRLFESSTQRSKKIVNTIYITPANEILPWKNKPESLKALRELDLSACSPENREQYAGEISRLLEGQRLQNLSFYAPVFNSGCLLDYVPSGALVVLDDRQRVQDEIEDTYNQSLEIKQQKIDAGELPANFPDPYFDWAAIKNKISERKNLNLLSWESFEDSGLKRLDFTPAPAYAGQLPALISKSKDFLGQGKRLIYVTNQANRLSELFDEADIIAAPLESIEKIPLPGSLTLLQGSLAEGFIMGSTYLLTDKEIFGLSKERHYIKRRAAQRHKLLVDIKPGDYVVHIEHGIGQFVGITNMSTDSSRKEYLVLTYAAGDKLYVPTDQIDRVSRYIGSAEQSPVLSRLGTQEWNRTKQKVKDSVEEIAEDLLKLYAARQIVPGYPFSQDTNWQREMEASFPYIETPDQIKVQEEVKEDMASPRPMDRLIVGDVGYGKTEIAIRAAFKAVMDNKQVAVLVPTTVLAEQHYLTFKQRMTAFPVRIDVLSRFRSPKEQKLVVEALAAGKIDICIGTHRLLQKDVVFKDLGLLVIDEEQRFGVAHKEHLKQLRAQVDVLTLSATPIPRTLHMSLVGARDMSLIETPPENRLPIKTYVAQYSDHLVRDAIMRELERNGQVFFVHNRVQGISLIAEKIKKLVPESIIDIAHGQMPEEKLEQVMLRFQKGESNVLVCTTIIESGLDLPNTNTLIVNRADKFGLTQLYQLRGRIGRGSNLAYAYFLYDRDMRLRPVAEQRLTTIFEASDLGAGFGIAMKDLEIRGAGSLLGLKQSGNISAVGFNLYTQLLAQAVEEQKSALKGQKRELLLRRPEPGIDLPLKAYIPEDYISDTDLRLSIYQRMTGLVSVEGAVDLAGELKDRFGPLPEEVQNLVFVVRLKALGIKAGIESISTNDGTVTIRMLPGVQIDRRKFYDYLRFGIKVGISQVIINLARLGKSWQKLLEEMIDRGLVTHTQPVSNNQRQSLQISG